jgi:DMSO/TMAO reductase YedYZ molybdopterin-dependent catalytic subunit
VDATETGITLEELQLAARNHGMPLEALRLPVTPVGLHYLLTHYDIPFVDADRWRLAVGGAVTKELSLGTAELRALDSREVVVTMECAGNGRARLLPRPISQPWLFEAVGTARWRGVRLRDLLDEAGVTSGAVEVLFEGLDHGIEGGVEQSYARSLPLADALREEVVLAYELNGAPLPPQHGFPLRLVVPGWYGMTNVKWLDRITVLEEPFDGYQQEQGYRLRQDPDDEGTPLTRMQPRALMAPPGIPDFMTRERTVQVGTCMLTGRAWSGLAPVARVEVSTDGGAGWATAELEPEGELGEWAWREWTFTWKPEAAGEHVLCCRATDEEGNRQPDEPAWNVGGYANNSVQRIPVTVQDSR